MWRRSIFKTMIIIVFILGLTGLVSAQTYTISGIVYDPDFSPVADVEVYTYINGDSYWGDFTDETGYYSLPYLEAGIYDVYIEPPTDLLAPTLISGVVVQFDVTLDVILEQGYIISGYVRDEQGIGILDIDLNVYDQITGVKLFTPSDNTNDSGYYDVVVPAGTYRIRYQYRGEDEDARYVPIELENVVVTTDTTINVVLESGYYVSGTVTDLEDNPVVDADLDAENSETGEKIFTPGDNTNDQGEYQLLLPPGTYDINVNPQISDRLVPEIICGVQVFSDITLDFELESGFLLSGIVRDPDLNEVVDVDLDVFDSITGEKLFTPSDNTDINGFYQLVLPDGTFDIIYKPPVVPPYLAPVFEPAVVFNNDTIIDVTLPFGFLLSGLIQNSSGVGVYGVDIDAEDAFSGIDVPLVGDHTDSSGEFSSVLVPSAYHLEIEPPIQRRLEARKLFDFILNADTSIVESLDTGMVVSGIVSNQLGSPMADVSITAIESYTLQEIFLPGNMTDLQGFYQILIHPDTYNLIFTTPDLLDSIVFYFAEVTRDTTIDVSFYTNAPAVTVLTPNGGENWPAFSEQLISWTADDDIGVTSIEIFYSTNGLTGPFSLISIGEDNDGEYLWNVPPNLTDDARIKIVAYDSDNNSSEDISDNSFTIFDAVAPSVNVITPNGGEEWPVGSEQTISWFAEDDVGVSSIDIYYSTTGADGTYALIVEGETNNGEYLWSVPPELTDDARIKVVAFDAGSNSSEDISDNSFTISDITAPSVTVIAPNGGEEWPVGSEQTISWFAEDDVAVSSIEIYYSTTGENGMFAFITEEIENDGEYLWNIPAEPTENAVIRIVALDASSNMGIDVSDNSFIIFQESLYYYYVPGDVNMALGLWPPSVIGGDVTYLVGYFIGGVQAPCMLDGFWASADVNGDCNIIGGDVTALVSYFVSGGSISNCPDYEPAWPPVPEEIPDDWPDCEPSVNNVKIIPSKTAK